MGQTLTQICFDVLYPVWCVRGISTDFFLLPFGGVSCLCLFDDGSSRNLKTISAFNFTPFLLNACELGQAFTGGPNDEEIARRCRS